VNIIMRLNVLWILLFILQENDGGMVTVQDYWPEVSSDLTRVTWSHATNSMDLLEDALEDATMMIAADVSMGKGFLPVMDNSSFTLDKFLETVIAAIEIKSVMKGVKLHIQSEDALQPTLEILSSFKDRIFFPVILETDIFNGPDGGPFTMSGDQFLHNTSQSLPGASLSLGFTTGPKGVEYTFDQLMSSVLWLTQFEPRVSSPVSLSLRASLLNQNNVQSLSRFLRMKGNQQGDPSLISTIIVWTESEDKVDKKALDLFVDLVGRDRVYLDLPWNNGRSTSGQRDSGNVDAGIVTIMEYWPEVVGDLTSVVWSHSTNTKKLLETALEDNTMMIGAEVSVEDGEPFMANSNFTLDEFMETILTAIETKAIKKGIKLHFNTLEVLQPALEVLSSFKDRIFIPLVLDADILSGPDGGSSLVDPHQFLTRCVSQLPGATLSVGWTTGPQGKYTISQLGPMSSLLTSHNITSPVSLSLRASLVTQSEIPFLSGYIEQAENVVVFPTVTVWSKEEDPVDRILLAEFLDLVGKTRVYLDVPWNNSSPGGPGLFLGVVLLCLSSVFVL